MHSLVLGKDDIYRARSIHLVCIDKPGVGGTSFEPLFRLRRDWPRIVAAVADALEVNDYGVFGISNGGPYVMATLTSPQFRARVRAAGMIVGVSDVRASGYFSCRHPSGGAEGCVNSLPTCLMGPCIWSSIKLLSCCLFSCGCWSCCIPEPLTSSADAASCIKTVLSDGAANFGRGAALDCQMTLSPLYARPPRTSSIDVYSGSSSSRGTPSGHERREGERGREPTAEEAYREVGQPVALWFGTADSTVPLYSADWLAALLPKATKHYVEAGHALYWFSTAKNREKHGVGYAEEVLDDLLGKMGLGTAAEVSETEYM